MSEEDCAIKYRVRVGYRRIQALAQIVEASIVLRNLGGRRVLWPLEGSQPPRLIPGLSRTRDDRRGSVSGGACWESLEP